MFAVQSEGEVMQRKPDVEETKDGRVILRGNAYKKMRLKLKGIAQGRCEKCGKHCENGDADHVRGRGAGKRDDRIFIDGVRNLQYLCRPCHSGKHVPEKVVPAKMTDKSFDELLGLGSREELES
jgi:5-methylcytosine-specific restriction endonuclease McrA